MNICIQDNCNLEPTSRGLCVKHYSYHYRKGTLNSVAAPPAQTRTDHSLSNIDAESKTGHCSVCGEIDIKLKRGYWRCGARIRETANTRKRARRAEGYVDPMTMRYGNGQSVPFAVAVAARKQFEEEQNGHCAICGRHESTTGTLQLDHCHETGKVRGLLCGSCNTGLYKFRDNPETLKTAIEYLTR